MLMTQIRLPIAKLLVKKWREYCIIFKLVLIVKPKLQRESHVILHQVLDLGKYQGK